MFCANPATDRRGQAPVCPRSPTTSRRFPKSDRLLAKKKRLAPTDLAADTLLLLGARNCLRDQVIEICALGASMGAPQKTLEGSSLETICQMVAMGAGVTILPSTMRINDDLAEHLVVRPFVAPQPTRTIAVFYRRGFARPQVIQCLASVVREAQLKGVDYCT